MIEEWWENSDWADNALEEMANELGVDGSEILLCDFFLWLEGVKNDKYSC